MCCRLGSPEPASPFPRSFSTLAEPSSRPRSRYGEVGLRVLLRGSGDRGSLFLTPTIGGGYLFGEKDETCGTVAGAAVTCTRDVSYGGPMVGIGAEWRL